LYEQAVSDLKRVEELDETLGAKAKIE